MGDQMGTELKIMEDLTSKELRAHARRERNGRASARMYAQGVARRFGIANALEGMKRADAARLAGMERQALRDAVVRYNAEGLKGLYDRPKGHRQRTLNSAEEAELAAVILKGPDPQEDGVSAWTRIDLCRWLEKRFVKIYHPSSLSRVLRRMGFSRQKTRSTHPKKNPESLGGVPKKSLPDALAAATAAHPGKQIQLWFQDEARVRKVPATN